MFVLLNIIANLRMNIFSFSFSPFILMFKLELKTGGSKMVYSSELKITCFPFSRPDATVAVDQFCSFI